MTECEQATGCCEIAEDCNVKENWSVISQVIAGVLKNISLQQMAAPLTGSEVPLKFYKNG
jgi:DNA-binding IscR family transcriptional regulator